MHTPESRSLTIRTGCCVLFLFALLLAVGAAPVFADDLAAIGQRGVLSA